MKIIKIRSISRELISIILTILSVLYSSFAAAAQNESYADWKAKQQQYDARLKQQQNQPSQNHSNHYLAKPELAAVSSADRIRLNSATVEQLQLLNIATRMASLNVLKIFSWSRGLVPHYLLKIKLDWRCKSSKFKVNPLSLLDTGLT